MYIYFDGNSKHLVAQTVRHVQKQAVAFRSPVWQSSDYAVPVRQRQNVLYRSFWGNLWIFCGKKEVAGRQVTLLQIESGDLTQKEHVRKKLHANKQ